MAATTTRSEPRKRGQGETVALTVRIPRAEWVRLHALALDQGESLQTLAVRGFNLVFDEFGLPKMTDTP